MRTMLQPQRGDGLLLSPNYSGLIGPEEAPGSLFRQQNSVRRRGLVSMQQKVAK